RPSAHRIRGGRALSAPEGYSRFGTNGGVEYPKPASPGERGRKEIGSGAQAIVVGERRELRGSAAADDQREQAKLILPASFRQKMPRTATEEQATAEPIAAPARTSVRKCIPSRMRESAMLAAQNNRAGNISG